MNSRKIEFLVGCFVLVGFGAVFYLAIQVGSARAFGGDNYTLQARFSSTSGVNAGSRVEIAGVRVGTVKAIVLNDNFYSMVTFELPHSIELDDDTIVSIKTAGLCCSSVWLSPLNTSTSDPDVSIFIASMRSCSPVAWPTTPRAPATSRRTRRRG